MLASEEYPPANDRRVPPSSVLQQLVDEAYADRVTIGWLMQHFRRRSFGIVLLLLGSCALLPGFPPLAELLLFLPGIQMIRTRQAPTFPKRFAGRSVPSAKFVSILRRMVPALRLLERLVRPCLATQFKTTGHVIGGFVLLLGLSRNEDAADHG